MLRLAVGLLATAVVLAFPAGARVAATPGEAAFVLLADGRLVRAAVPRGAIRVRRLGALQRTIQSGPLLAFDARRRRVYALLRDHVAVVDERKLEVERRIALPSGLVYRGLVVGPATGRLYVAANRTVRVVDRSTGLAEEDAVVLVLDPGAGSIVARWTAREAAGRSWYVYWLAITPDERSLVLSYHGGCDTGFDTCTTGADMLELAGGSLRPCEPLPPRFNGAACSPDVHGAVVPYGNGFLAATGTPRVVELDRLGQVVRALSTSMPTHLMDISVDRDARTLYAIGSCEKAGGLRAVDLDSGRVRRLRTARGSRALCGSRVEPAGGSLAVATGGGAPPFRSIRPALLLVDARSGRTIRRIGTGDRIVGIAVG